MLICAEESEMTIGTNRRRTIEGQNMRGQVMSILESMRQRTHEEASVSSVLVARSETSTVAH